MTFVERKTEDKMLKKHYLLTHSIRYTYTFLSFSFHYTLRSLLNRLNRLNYIYILNTVIVRYILPTYLSKLCTQLVSNDFPKHLR